MSSANAQPVADAETELATYLASPGFKYATLVYDEAKGFRVRKHEGQKGIPASPLEWWKVGSAILGTRRLIHLMFCDILCQEHANDYKFGLPQMARDYLAIPGTTVDLERQFSIVGDMITKKRNRLSGDTVRAVQLLRNWDKNGLFDIVDYWTNKDVRK